MKNLYNENDQHVDCEDAHQEMEEISLGNVSASNSYVEKSMLPVIRGFVDRNRFQRELST